MRITFNRFEFTGLRIKRYEKFPWVNDTQKAEFYGELQKNNTNYNKQKAEKFSELEAKENIHLNLSKSYLSLGVSIIFLVLIALTLSIATFGTIMIFSGVVLIGLLGKFLFKKRADANFLSLKMDYMVIDQIF